ncbi:MAG: YwaF family protein [Erysipelotrichaceae bacterium]|jgi:hypothetical protein|nr:YwaF family protein [Erysipelotrichaceae bacterium]MCI1327308.1 YwaF family protein [Solobacterium sp.]MCH4044673.1 YwaF family protein [Erysipelotrichaceae bacterium]MCH4121885.1 YwaF family protein [Erysipelotrichaceae bacterium]MCI1364096.1 YwaF family protein [Solobacterium sp.]
MKKILHDILARFFADEGIYPAAGIPSKGYFVLIIATILCIYFGLKHTLQWSYTRIRSLIKTMIVILCLLEIIKIGWRFYYGYGPQLNTWVPLYFCSITLFAGILSAFAKGTLQHIGDVFLCTGGLCGGIVFLMYPATSLMSFPAFHFLSIHSFLYHGCMTYLGILMNRSGLVCLKSSDFRYYAMYVLFFCILALILNQRKDSNLMFISKPLDGTMYQLMGKICGKLYTPLMILIQMTIPFAVILWFKNNTALLSRPAWYGMAAVSALHCHHVFWR